MKLCQTDQPTNQPTDKARRQPIDGHVRVQREVTLSIMMHFLFENPLQVIVEAYLTENAKYFHIYGITI